MPSLHAQNSVNFLEPDLGSTQETVEWFDYEAAIFRAPTDNRPDADTFDASGSSSGFIQNTQPGFVFITSGGAIYSPTVELNLTATLDFDPLDVTDITNVVFQFRSLGSPLDFTAPELNYNGGSQGLTADLFAIRTRESGMGFFGGAERTFLEGEYALQWDLSGIGESITFFEINWSHPLDASLQDVRIDVAEGAFEQVVPEPSTFTLVIGGGSLLLVAAWRRGRASLSPRRGSVLRKIS
ncbi:MAG: hypothetical protein ACFBZ8_12790 [Opitutales bacterium]